MSSERGLRLDEKTVSLLKGYITKAKEKLHASGVLLRSGDYEDAVSRAYYVAFHAARAVLLTDGLVASTHQGVVNLFGLHFVRTGRFDKKFGRFLTNLKDERENSDYEIYTAIDKAVAKHAVQEAREFLKAVENYLKPFLQGS